MHRKFLLLLVLSLAACAGIGSPPNAPSEEETAEASSALLTQTVAIQRGGPAAFSTVADAIVRSDAVNTVTTGTAITPAVLVATPPTANTLRHAYLRFDVSGIPAGSTINSASLVLWANNRVGSPVIRVHEASCPVDGGACPSWTEATLTWATAPAYGTAFTGTFPATTGQVSFPIPATTVQGWLSGPNNGLVVETDTATVTSNENFASSEDTYNNGMGHHPALVLSYTAPASCFDGEQNGGEAGVDCGGSCIACPTCSDGIQNGGELGVDCGGPCTACGDGGGITGFTPQGLVSGAWKWTVSGTQGSTTYQSADTSLYVVVPPQCTPSSPCKTLYVLPVSAGDDTSMLAQAIADKVANQFGLVIVATTFAADPWGTDCGSELQDSWIPSVIGPFIDTYYPTTGPSGRLLIGYSKAAYVAITSLLRHPSAYRAAGAWDGPLNMTNRPETRCDDTTFNANYYVPSLISGSYGTPFVGGTARFIIDGYSSSGLQSAGYSVASSMTTRTIPRVLNNATLRNHAPDSGWFLGMVRQVFEL